MKRPKLDSKLSTRKTKLNMKRTNKLMKGNTGKSRGKAKWLTRNKRRYDKYIF